MSLESTITSLRSVSHTSTHQRTSEIKVTSVNYDEQILLDLKKKNEFLMQEINRLRQQNNVPQTQVESPGRLGMNPSKLLLTTITGVRFEGGSSTQHMGRTYLELPMERFNPAELSFEADTDSELFRRYTILHKQYIDCSTDLEALRNENSRLKSDIITLSGKNLNPDLVALNRRSCLP